MTNRISSLMTGRKHGNTNQSSCPSPTPSNTMDESGHERATAEDCYASIPKKVCLQYNVQVRFYRRKLFFKTFREFYSDFNELRASLSPEYNRKQVFKSGKGAGRSGSFFFFSHDNKYIIKTLSKRELTLMLEMLPSLAKHYKRNPGSLIAKIIGLFTINSDSTRDVHVMLMENTLRFVEPRNIQSIFDLKGSRVDRSTKGVIKNTTTLKDVDFLNVLQRNPGFIDLDKQ